MPNINDPRFDEPRKLGANERLPGGGGLRAMFRMADTVDYHEGEQAPAKE